MCFRLRSTCVSRCRLFFISSIFLIFRLLLLFERDRICGVGVGGGGGGTGGVIGCGGCDGGGGGGGGGTGGVIG